MQNALPARYAAVVSFTALITIPSPFSQELVRNGNFEGGRLPPWAATQVPGSSIALAAESSPFTTAYPAGGASVRLVDDDSDFEEPSLRQAIQGQPSVIFGFDFKAPTAPIGGSSWFVGWKGDTETETNTFAFFFSLGGADGNSLDLNQQKIADLKANTWYHVEGFADGPSGKLEGTVTNALGESAQFSGTFPFGVQTAINAVQVSDGDAGPNEDLLLDNFFSYPLALEISRNAQAETMVTWKGQNITLQATTTLGTSADWTDIPGAQGSFTNNTPDGMRFFRLRR